MKAYHKFYKILNF